jgi:malate dehydrogenase (oxaloacetate-decarboxylating)
MNDTSHNPMHAGQDILNDPLRNKGTAFTLQERRILRIEGHLPPAVETVEEQLARTRHEFDRFEDELEQHIYLRALQDSNEVLFHRFVRENLADTLPIVYTPTVGRATQEFSRIYRRPRGLFLSWESRSRMREQLASVDREIDVIVATDGERILGLGDQGAGGMGIPIGKLSLYSAFGGIDPARTLPIMLDVGTNNEDRLGGTYYLGLRQPRITPDEYDAFLEQFVDEVKRRWPNVLLQWEDFAQHNATRLLDRHRERILSFNDDIQGTAAVSLAAIQAAIGASGGLLADQRICILGAGSAGTGIASMLRDALADAGVDAPLERIILIDAEGIVHDERSDLRPHQIPLAHAHASIASWADVSTDVLETALREHRASILVGVSGQPGLFTEAAIRTMAAGCSAPIIMPLSNPTSRAEAAPEDLFAWTDGRAIVATGSPFEPVMHDGVAHTISQSNNVYVFPGVGLGAVAAQATAISDEMLMVAARTVADPDGVAAISDGVLPPLDDVPEVSMRIARAVARIARDRGLAPDRTNDELDARIDEMRWTPTYPKVI